MVATASQGIAEGGVLLMASLIKHQFSNITLLGSICLRSPVAHLRGLILSTPRLSGLILVQASPCERWKSLIMQTPKFNL
jgi:hypothetical protein